MKLQLLPRSCDATVFVASGTRLHTNCFFKAQTRTLDLSGVRTAVNCPDLVFSAQGTEDMLLHGGRIRLHVVKSQPDRPNVVLAAPYCIGNVNRESGYICWGERNQAPGSIPQAINQFLLAPFNNHWIPGAAEAYNTYPNLEELFVSEKRPLVIADLNVSLTSVQQVVDLVVPNEKEVDVWVQKSPETKEELEKFQSLYLRYMAANLLLETLARHVPAAVKKVDRSSINFLQYRLQDVHLRMADKGALSPMRQLEAVRGYGCLCIDCTAEIKKLEDQVRLLEANGLSLKLISDSAKVRENFYYKVSALASTLNDIASGLVLDYGKWVPNYRPSPERYEDYTGEMFGVNRVCLPGGIPAVVMVKAAERVTLPKDMADKYPVIGPGFGSPIPVEIRHLVDGVEYVINISESREYVHKASKPLPNGTELTLKMFQEVKKEEPHGKVEDAVKGSDGEVANAVEVLPVQGPE